MESIRGFSPGALYLCLNLSAFLLGSGVSVSSSLWGKKVQFTSHPCLWQLQTGSVVPALEELTVCVLLSLNYTTAWTGFVYKAPGFRHVELGLKGSGAHLSVWLFGVEKRLERELKLHEQYSVCITWSGMARRVRVYINDAHQQEYSLDPSLPQHLTPNGTFTLGVSHYVDGSGEVKAENGNNLLGEVSLFRMWARERRTEELGGRSCADGDVLSWDTKQWNHNCPTKPDKNFHCAWWRYRINMWTFLLDSSKSGNCSPFLKDITRVWLENVFPRNISVRDITVSSPSRICYGSNNSSVQASNTTCDRCFSCEVYVDLDPAADVDLVQTNIVSLLSRTFSYGFIKLTADPGSIGVLPVELLPAITEPPPTSGPVLMTSESGPTESPPAWPANVTTTFKPVDFNETTVSPDTFFRVTMILSLSSSSSCPEDLLQRWVRDQLEVNKTMTVLNLIIKEDVVRNVGMYYELTILHGQEKRYDSTFQVQDYSSKAVGEVQAIIQAALTSGYRNNSVSIGGLDVVVRHIEPQNCLEETTSTIYGEYIWPEAFPQVNQEMGCMKPTSKRAYRLCQLHSETDSTSWARPDMRNCEAVVTISDLDNINITTGNAAEVVGIIQELVDVQLDSSEELSGSELHSVVEKLQEVVDISVIQPDVGAIIVSVVSDILLSETDIMPVANSVLNLTETMGKSMDFQNESISVTVPLLALSMTNVLPDQFIGLTFGVSSMSPSMKPKVFLSQSFVSEPITEADASISLPSELHNFFRPGLGNKTRVQFNFYGTTKLFQDPLTANTSQSSWTLNSFIVSASVNNSHVCDLKDGVVVTLKHLTSTRPEDKVQCMFWDFQMNGGQGGWSSSGCKIKSSSSNWTSCLCSHLTHFAVLLDVSRSPVSDTDAYILTLISYLGCGVSSIFLGVTLLTYLTFEKLRKDNPSKILINLCAALLGLNMLFLLNSWLSSFSNYGLCIATAAALHYFLLASFTWMGLEAVHMYHALVKVFNIYIPSYILKFCAAGWGIPLVVVSLVLAVDKDVYGGMEQEEAITVPQFSDQFCWLQDDVVFYVTVVAFILLILLFNISIFLVVLIQIRQIRANKPSANGQHSLQDLRAVASLTVLLGLSWSMGFFTVGPGQVVLMYLFTICNTLQGFFVFLFHCLLKENVRKQWRIHLYCGPFRLSDYSEWTQTVTVGGPRKNNHLINSESAVSNSSSTHRKDSASSIWSAPNNLHEA